MQAVFSQKSAENSTLEYILDESFHDAYYDDMIDEGSEMKTEVNAKSFRRSQPVWYCSNPAKNAFLRVTFVRWFDKERSYARVKFPSGTYLSVPVHCVFTID